MQRCILIYLFLSALGLKSNAQHDSSLLSIDTVILLKEPFIVKREVILGNGSGSIISRSPKKLSGSILKYKWSVLMGVFTGPSELKTPATSKNYKAYNNSQAYLNLVLHHHNFQFGFGAGLASTTLQYSNFSPEYRSKTETIKVYDYSNASTVILPGRIIFEGVTTWDSAYTVNYTELKETRIKARLLYLTVPLNIAYRLNLENKKWFIMPQLEIIPNILISEPSENAIDTPEAILWMYGGNCSVGYDMTANLSILARVHLQNSMGGVYKGPEPLGLRFTGYGFALSYKLN